MFVPKNYELVKEVFDLLQPLFLRVSSNEDVIDTEKFLIALRDKAGEYVLPSERIAEYSDVRTE
tara:strand:- start:240 stop:431 length:192 start_codon:yes stop_codon:yes gene_type:complete